jgi:hypothetical protein
MVYISWRYNMLPILLGIGTAISSAITATEAVAIGAATATGVSLLSRNHKSADNAIREETKSEKFDSVAFETAFREAYAKAYKGGNITTREK